MKRMIITIASIMLVALAFGQAIYKGGEVRLSPRLLNYQGFLTDTLGNPITNPSVSMTFGIWSLSGGGTQIWYETQTVAITKGIFSVLLGGLTPIPDSVFTKSTDRWLELTYAGITLSPRTRIVSVPYAYTSTLADTAGNARLLQGKDTIALDARFVNEGQVNSIFTPMIIDTAVTMAKIACAGASTNQVIKWTGTAWQPGSDVVGTDMDWNYLISDVADTTLQMGGRWGLARPGNTLYGNADSTHVNFGVGNTTGRSGMNYKYCTVTGGRANIAGCTYATVGGGYSNNADSTYATVSGGYNNTAGLHYAVVGGGYTNIASGFNATINGGRNNYASDSCAFIGGGRYNRARGPYSVVSGGGGAAVADSNLASGYYAVVGGGRRNIASNYNATVAGGFGNVASNGYTTIGGGNTNIASGNGTTVGGGYSNSASGEYAFVGGGENNTASGYLSAVVSGNYNVANDTGAFVGGGRKNYARGRYSVINGGGSSSVNDSNSIRGEFSVIGGGRSHIVIGNFSTVSGGIGHTINSDGGTVAGGEANTASFRSFVGGGSFNSANGAYSAVAGGLDNVCSGQLAAVGGGSNNTASNNNGVVGGGDNNTASGNRATVGGGRGNIVSGNYATIAGGYSDTCIADYSFAVGNNSTVLNIFANSAAFNGQTATGSGQTRVGMLSKVSGTFTIDHPMDPENKILNHYFVESPGMTNIYEGEAVLDGSGHAEITLPVYFDALNRTPRAQLTGIGTSDVYVAEKVKGNRFIIGGKPGTEVYWMVTADRKDPSAEITRIIMPVEQVKEGGLVNRSLDDEFLVTTMEQLERMGKADGFKFHHASEQNRYEEMKRMTEKGEKK